VDEAIGGDDLIGLEQQQREQAPLLEAAERERPALAPDLEWAKDPEVDRALHAAKLTRGESARDRLSAGL
jgi:hypothetical protein